MVLGLGDLGKNKWRGVVYFYLVLTSFDRNEIGLGLRYKDWASFNVEWTLGFGNKFGLGLLLMDWIKACWIFRFCIIKITRTTYVTFQTSRVKSANLQKSIPGTKLAKSEKMKD